MLQRATLLFRGMAATAVVTLAACGGGSDRQDVLAFADRCTQLVGKAVGAGTILSTELRVESSDQPEACIAKGEIVSTPTSTIKFLIELPVDSRWNRDLLQLGGGGYNGVVSTVDSYQPFHLGSVRNLGFVIAGSDSGHGGTSREMGWALDNPSAFDNFAFNAHPQLLAATMDVVQAIYSAVPAKKYFWGISTGGREALQQAQRFPENYDGIIAGMPVVDYSSVNQKSMQVAQLAFGAGGAGWLNPTKVRLVGDAQLGACDDQDGLADGTISNWRGCRFDPQTLRCPDGADTGDTCLSDGQLATVRALRSRTTLPAPLANSVTTVPSYGIGGEAGPLGWATFQLGAGAGGPGGVGTLFASEWLKYVVTSDPLASVVTYAQGSDASRWLEVSQKANSTDPDLSAFLARGGKLIVWHGTSDHLVPPGYSVDYYASVVSKLGQTRTDSAVRLYMLPSVGHGAVGGAGMFDQLQVLKAWVEEGMAPDNLVGRAFASATTPFTRPICRYPAWPKYSGSGDVNSAESFSCVVD